MVGSRAPNLTTQKPFLRPAFWILACFHQVWTVKTEERVLKVYSLGLFHPISVPLPYLSSRILLMQISQRKRWFIDFAKSHGAMFPKLCAVALLESHKGFMGEPQVFGGKNQCLFLVFLIQSINLDLKKAPVLYLWICLRLLLLLGLKPFYALCSCKGLSAERLPAEVSIQQKESWLKAPSYSGGQKEAPCAGSSSTSKEGKGT